MLSALILVLPALKNVALYLRYEHNRQTFARVSGSRGGVAGTWEAAYDAYPCAMDTHYHDRLTLGADGRGRLTETMYAHRVGIGASPYVYTWASLLPVDHHRCVRTSSSSVRDSLGTLIIEPDESSRLGHVRYALYRVHGDELYLWTTGPPGEVPVHRQNWFPNNPADLRDLIQPGW